MDLNIDKQVQNKMDLNIDKQVQELLYIKMGLQNQIDKNFKQLLGYNENDPLQDIYQSLVHKNHQINQLKRQIATLKTQVPGYKEIKPSSAGLKMSINQNSRNSSLPQNHNDSKQKIQQKKKQVADLKEKYVHKVDSFIIFLLKCIRQISRVGIKQGDDKDKQLKVKHMINNLQHMLQKQKNRVLQRPQKSQKQSQISGNKAYSQISTQHSTQHSHSSSMQTQKNNQNLQRIIKQLNDSKANSQSIFSKISQQLGLKNKWDSFINELKQQSRMYKFLREKVLKIDPQNNQSAKQLKTQQVQKLINDKNYNWSSEIQRMIEQAKQQNSKPGAQNTVNYVLQDTKKQLLTVPQQTFNVLSQTIKYFYQKLDYIFKKHNQYPYQLGNRPQIQELKSTVREFYMRAQYKQSIDSIKAQIDNHFFMLQRRTKFYSANRGIFRNNNTN